MQAVIGGMGHREVAQIFGVERAMNLPVLQRLWQPDPQAKPKQRGGRKRQRQPNPDYPSKPELARQMLDLVAARFPGRRIGLVGDLKSNAAALYAPKPPRTGKRGQAAKNGKPLPSSRADLDDGRSVRISIAMATYNGEQFIAEQLESIARQSRLPDELVVSDDGSSDSTVEIVRQFASRAPFDVVVLRNQEHIANPEPWFRGYTDNFFRAMRACTGDLIALCDQDDVWHADKLMKSARPLQLDQDVSLVIHSSRVVDEDLRPIWVDPSNLVHRRHRLPAGSVPPFPEVRAGFAMMFRSIFVKAAAHVDTPCFKLTWPGSNAT